MGIKNFTKFLKDKYPNCFRQIHISEFKEKKIGIESHLFLYKFKCAQFSTGYAKKNNQNWKVQIMHFLLSLRKFNVHPVIIFEGMTKPDAKSDTVKQRIETRQKAKQRIQMLNDLYNMVLRKQDISREFLDTLASLSQDISIFPELHKKISGSSVSETDLEDIDTTKMTKRDLLLNKHPALKIINNEIEKLEKRTVNITNDDIDTLRFICDGIGVKHIQAPCEAEAYLCRLLKNNKIDGVMTDDSDVCAYGCNVWLTKYTFKQYNEEGLTNTVYKCDTDEVCSEMGITKEQFMDLCVLCGTDYCENPKNLGPVKLLKLIKENENYKDKLWNEEYEDARNIFLTQGVSENYPDIEWSTITSIKTIKEMLEKIECKDKPEKIRKNLYANVTIIE